MYTIKNSKPTFKQGAYISAIAASLEGGTAFITAIIKKKRLGKTISEFTKDDWLEISKDSGIGAIKGSTRGITIYALTNYTATPAAVASSLCTASFGIAEEAYKFRKNNHKRRTLACEVEHPLKIARPTNTATTTTAEIIIPLIA